jgi:2-polyprenyl-3-methyl-5-hydroxy-6-metoxy-1,4-benzoquinol methylase
VSVPEDHFGERVAERYDDSLGEMADSAVVESTVGVLAGLAGGGAALELGIGTGRIALPLAKRGIPVHGIDSRRRWSHGCVRSRVATRST